MALKRRISKLWWRALKWVGIVIVFFFLLFGIVSWVLFEKKNAWLLREILAYVDETQAGQLEIETIDLKLFKNFPNITLELGGVNYYEHRDSVRLPDERPILHADDFFVSVELFPLLREEVNVTQINLSSAQLNIVEYENGKLNIDRALAKPAKRAVPIASNKVTPKPKPAPTPAVKKINPDSTAKKKPKPVPKPKPGPRHALKVDLDLIRLDETLIRWKSNTNTQPSVILVKELYAYLFEKDGEQAVKLTSSYQIRSLYVNNSLLPAGDLRLNVDLVYNRQKQQLTIEKSKITYDLFSATIQGTYAHQKNRALDLQIDASSNELALLSLIIRHDVIRRNPNLISSGRVYAKGKVFGELQKQPPQFDFSFGIRDLTLKPLKKLGEFKNINLEGTFASGGTRDYSLARFEIRKLRAEVPGGFLKGQFGIYNFVEPKVNYKLEAQVSLDGFDQIFQIDFLKELKGSISLNADFNGPFKLFAEHAMDSSRSSFITLNNLSFVVTKTRQLVSGFSGKIENENNRATLQDVAFHYGKNDLLLNGSIDNLVYFIFKGERDIVAQGNLRANQIFTKDFIIDTLQIAQVRDRMSEISFDFLVRTSASKQGKKSTLPDIAFDIRNLTAKLEKLPDIKMVNTSGKFSQTDNELRLNLDEFHAMLPQGRLDLAGDLVVRSRGLWEFNAKLKTDKFPWTYVSELAAEIRDDSEPSAKRIPVAKMELLTTDLDLSAAIVTFPFDINKLVIRDSRAILSMPGTKPISAEKINMALQNLYFNHPENSAALTGLKSMRGTLEFSHLVVPGLSALDFKTNITGENDKLDIGFSSLSQIIKDQKGHLALDISKKQLGYHLQYFVRGASLEYFVQKFYKKKLMEGSIDYSLDFHTVGSTWDQVKKNLSGEIEITGDSLKLYGIDVDDVLRKYKKSQNFNLTDVGAVLIAGPVGLAVTKGSDFVSLAAINFNSGDQTHIKKLLTNWKLKDGVLTAQDVAFATSTNRIAFDGQIDLARDSIPGVTISVVDRNGCSLMDQRLYGKVGNIKTGKLNVTKTLLGSVINFANAVVGKDCRPVYTGGVKDPSGR